MEPREHWDRVYQTKGDAELSWFQSEPTVSLALIDSLQPPPRNVIDVGGGQSAVAGELLSRGVERITVLDIARAAIDRGRSRLGPRADRVQWTVADVLSCDYSAEFDLWHDRAVFHFLTAVDDRRRYVAAASKAVRSGGHLVVATFSLTGPEKCSGLPTCRYDAAGLASEFGEAFQFVQSASENHTTPWGKTQAFTYVLLARK